MSSDNSGEFSDHENYRRLCKVPRKRMSYKNCHRDRVVRNPNVKHLDDVITEQNIFVVSESVQNHVKMRHIYPIEMRKNTAEVKCVPHGIKDVCEEQVCRESNEPPKENKPVTTLPSQQPVPSRPVQTELPSCQPKIVQPCTTTTNRFRRPNCEYDVRCGPRDDVTVLPSVGQRRSDIPTTRVCAGAYNPYLRIRTTTADDDAVTVIPQP